VPPALVGSGVQEVAVRRSAPEVGDVVVHFPRAGFGVQTAWKPKISGFFL